MKLVNVALLGMAALSFASDDGNFGFGAPLNPQHIPGTDVVDITVIETWAPGLSQILGLDWYNDEDGYILMASATEDRINRWNANTEALDGFIDLMDTNTACFGVAAGPAGSLFTSNDWSMTNLYVCSSGPTWTDLPTNPAGSNGRGMEFDEETGNYWEVGTSGTTYTLYRFTPGVGEASYVITEPTNQLSGIAVFPYNGNLGVVVTCYNVHNFYFYEFDGSSLTYIDMAPCPIATTSSFGLCYANSRDTFFWSWSAGTPSLTEFSIGELSLSPATWGSIKTMF